MDTHKTQSLNILEVVLVQASFFFWYDLSAVNSRLYNRKDHVRVACLCLDRILTRYSASYFCPQQTLCLTGASMHEGDGIRIGQPCVSPYIYMGWSVQTYAPRLYCLRRLQLSDSFSTWHPLDHFSSINRRYLDLDE